MKYRVYLLRLPSGGVVRVRKTSPLVLLSHGIILSPLVRRAMELTASSDDEPKQPETEQDFASILESICDAALVDRDIFAADLPWHDKLFLQGWAVGPSFGQATKESERDFGEADFTKLLESDAAIFLDVVCRRYQARPSEMLGLTDPDVAIPVDLSIGYRASVKQNQTQKGEDEVEVEDVWGNKIKVPRAIAEGGQVQQQHPGVPYGARVVNADDLARRYGPITLSAGGAYGDGMIGPMPGAGGQRFH